MTNAMDVAKPQQLEQLLAQCALGSQSAFSQLYKAVAAKLNGIAYRILNDTESANEVLQEAFLQIWHKAGEYRSDKAEPMTWMASIVRYRAYDRIRFEQRRIEGAQIQSDLESFDIIADERLNQALTCELDQQLEHCLATLETNQQGSILMAYYYGFSREEISGHFEAPINTVKSWLHRGIERLQQCLKN